MWAGLVEQEDKHAVIMANLHTQLPIVADQLKLHMTYDQNNTINGININN